MYVQACVHLLLDISQLDQLLWFKMTKELLFSMLTVIFSKEEDIATYKSSGRSKNLEQGPS